MTEHEQQGVEPAEQDVGGQVEQPAAGEAGEGGGAEPGAGGAPGSTEAEKESGG